MGSWAITAGRLAGHVTISVYEGINQLARLWLVSLMEYARFKLKEFILEPSSVADFQS